MTRHFPSPLLVVEASTSAGSVALVLNDQVAAERSVTMGVSRDDVLLPAIAEMLQECRIAPSAVKAVACGSGPGSFTSLRIAASLAKGFVAANGGELYAVSSLLLAAAELAKKPGKYLLHSDALRGERYVSLLSVESDALFNISAVARAPREQLATLAQHNNAQIYAVGPVANNTEPSSNEAGTQETALVPHARNITALAALWRTFGPVPLASWEPDYGRLAEAQVKWESAHGRDLPVG